MYRSRIVFFGTGVYEITSRHLKMFLENEANIVALVEAPSENISTTIIKNNPYENIGEVAERLKIPVYHFEDMEEPDLMDFIKSFDPEIIVVCGFQQYVPQQIRKLAHRGAVNFHSSLLPRHAGMHPGFFTIYYGDSKSGMVIHYMDDGIDTGDILYQSEVPVKEGDTVETLYDRIWNSSEPLIKQFLKDLDYNTLPGKPQDMENYFYNYELSEKDFELDFRQPADLLYRRVAMMPGKFYFIAGNDRYYVDRCSIVKAPSTGRRYVLRKPYKYIDKLIFLTPRNYLQIDEVSKDGKKIDPLTIARETF